MKMLRIMLMLALLVSLLSGCDTCEHQWEAANCAAPKTCTLCGETEGEPMGDHTWEEATTERPKTCSVCRKTEGDAIETDDRFTTAACKPLFGNWEIEYVMDGAEMGLNGIELTMKMTITFRKDGEMTVTTQCKNPDAAISDLAKHLEDMMYAQYQLDGMDRAQADADCLAQHGQTVTNFCKFRADVVIKNMKSIEDGVYYVEDAFLYTAEDWDSDMEEEPFEITEDGKLMLTTEFAEEPQAFIRVAIATQ